MTEHDLARAPWTDGQVINLRLRQNVNLHQYTCNGIEQVVHRTVALIPSRTGWTCPICSYYQDWAFAADANTRWWETNARVPRK